MNDSYNNKQNCEKNKRDVQRLKKFGVISTVLFAVVTVMSFVFLRTCDINYCNFDLVNIMHIVLISAGTIGLGYCFIILKSFNPKKTSDHEIKKVKDVLLDDNKYKDNRFMSF